MKIILSGCAVIILLCSAAFAQDADYTYIPEEPDTTYSYDVARLQDKTGTGTVINDGSPNLTLPDAPYSYTDDLPDAPSAIGNTNVTKPKTWKEYKGKKAGFFTIRRSTDPVPLRTTKQTILSKSFIATEVGMWSLGIADAKLNGCKGTAPCGKELYIDAFVPLAVVSGFHYIATRWIGAVVGAVGPGVATEIHTKGLITGVYP